MLSSTMWVIPSPVEPHYISLYERHKARPLEKITADLQPQCDPYFQLMIVAWQLCCSKPMNIAELKNNNCKLLHEAMTNLHMDAFEKLFLERNDDTLLSGLAKHLRLTGHRAKYGSNTNETHFLLDSLSNHMVIYPCSVSTIL